MKTYIFVIRRITYITGAVQYVYNKTNYLESKGWRVLIFSALHGPLYVEKFEKYKKNIYPELFLTPNCFRKKIINDVVDQIVGKIGDCQGDLCIVESDALQRAVWAELIAQRLGCRHLALFVRETHKYFDEKALDFLRFKYNRHELAGITKESICQILYDDTVVKREDTHFAAYCNNVIEDVKDNYSSMLDDDVDYSFGYLGRLEKPCVPSIVEGMCSYILQNPDKVFNIVMIGGSTNNERIMFIRNKFGSLPNVHLIMTGNMYPIPLSFAKRIDIFISTAGAASATYNVGIPTIRVNPLNGDVVGIVGLDFMPGEKSMFDSSPDLILKDYINKALKQRDMIVYSNDIEDYYKRMFDEFDRQLCFTKSIDSNAYYEKKKLFKIKTANARRKAFWIIGHLFGNKGIQFWWNKRQNTKAIFSSNIPVKYV